MNSDSNFRGGPRRNFNGPQSSFSGGARHGGGRFKKEGNGENPRQGFKREGAPSDFRDKFSQGTRHGGGRPFERRDGASDAQRSGKRQIALPPYLNRARSLHSEKGREKEQSFLVEGLVCVDEVLTHSPELVIEIFYRHDFNDEALLSKIEATKVRAKGISPTEFDEVASTQNSQGILAVCKMAQLKPKWETARRVTLIDAVQDPGNLGAIFRSSLGFGMDAILVGSGSVDAFNPKVVRGSSGTFLRVPFEQKVDLAERIRFLQSKGFTVVATSSHAKDQLDILAKKKKVAFLVGNEGSGANSKYVDMANEWVKIPMIGGLESLNVAVAHGVVAWELSKWKQG